MSEKNHLDEFSTLLGKIDLLEKRVLSLEKQRIYSPYTAAQLDTDSAPISIEKELSVSDDFEGDSIESHIGEYGLAWFGNIVLFFGGVFLHKLILSMGESLWAAVMGYAFVLAMVLFAKSIRNSFTYLASIFDLFAKFMLFYVTLSLHFFSLSPLIENLYIGIGLLVLIISYQVFQSLKLKSQKHTYIALFFLLITAVLSNETHIILPILTIATAGSVFLMFRFGWSKILLLTLNLIYFTFLMWVMGNPLVNSGLKIISSSQFSEYYLLIIAALYSTVFLIKKNGKFPTASVFSVLILNGMGFSFLLILLTLQFFQGSYQFLFASLSVFCILYSLVLKKYSDWKYAPALYAVYGFVAISITFYGIFKLPLIFLTLSLQSLLVLSMALWFRSRIIVVMNTFMFITLTIVYLAFFDSVNIINFSLPIVAAISARIINWQQLRLTLQTQFIRNFYLFVLYFTLLYALKKALPSEYITLSWSLAAAIYFGLSIILRLVKYRYLAIASLAAAAGYLFFVDLAVINVAYRIVAFLVLAIISIGISVYYVDKARKKNMENVK